MEGIVFKDGAKPFCTLCGISVPSDTPKAIKQHLKSKTHKIAQRTGAQIDDENNVDVTFRDCSIEEQILEKNDADEERCELCRLRNVKNTRHSVDAFRRSLEKGENVVPCFPPKFVRSPKSLFPRCREPFVTLESGRIPEVPNSLEQCLDLYCNAGANDGNKPPNVDIGGENVRMKSLASARRALLQAESSGTIYWAALVVDAIEHPVWWPRKHKSALCVDEGDVPNFNQVIIGSGPTDIGIHIDNAPAPGACSRGMKPHGAGCGSLVETACGLHKHQETSPDNLKTTSELMSGESCNATSIPDKIRTRSAAADDGTAADGAAVAGGGIGRDGGGALDYVDATDPQYLHCLSAGDESVHVDTYITMARGGKAVIMLPSGANFFRPKEPFPRTVGPELVQRILDAGGYYFGLEPVDDGGDGGGASGGHVTLFTPKGWHHWLLGRTEWHLIFGASRF